MSVCEPFVEEDDKTRRERQKWYFGIALTAVLLTASLIYIVIIAVWNMPPLDKPEEPRPAGEWLHFLFAGLVALASVCGLYFTCSGASRLLRDLLLRQQKAELDEVKEKKAKDERERAQKDVRRRASFGKALHALGFILLLFALLVIVVFAGFADKRYLVIINKVSPTPGLYPRRPGTPAKRPLI